MDAEFIKELAMGMNRATLAGMTSGAEVGRMEAQAEIKRLRAALADIADSADYDRAKEVARAALAKAEAAA